MTMIIGMPSAIELWAVIAGADRRRLVSEFSLAFIRRDRRRNWIPIAALRFEL